MTHTVYIAETRPQRGKHFLYYLYDSLMIWLQPNLLGNVNHFRTVFKKDGEYWRWEATAKSEGTQCVRYKPTKGTIHVHKLTMDDDEYNRLVKYTETRTAYLYHPVIMGIVAVYGRLSGRWAIPKDHFLLTPGGTTCAALLMDTLDEVYPKANLKKDCDIGMIQHDILQQLIRDRFTPISVEEFDSITR